MKKDYKLISKLAWEAFHIPVYVYQKKKLIHCCPEQEEFLHPLQKDLDGLWRRECLSYSTTNNTIYVKLPCVTDRNLFYVCGPVSSLVYRQTDLLKLHREYEIDSGNKAIFDAFFTNIPTKTQNEFLHLMQIVYFMINDSEINISAFLSETMPMDENSKHAARNLQTETLYQKKEYEYRNDSYEIENIMLNLVRRGDLKGMEDFIASIPSYHPGTVANDVLRMQKNYIITTISLVTRAAIESGMSKDRAFVLSDLYITRLESLTNMIEINQLTTDMLIDYTGQMSEIIKNALVPIGIEGIPPAVSESMSFIKSNTNEKLSVASVAKELGYDRSYLSNLFSKTLGFSMSAYITRCKLEEAKMLLVYTDKSLREISGSLCFSSQSHFQLRLRETFHTTPLKYRESARHK